MNSFHLGVYFLAIILCFSVSAEQTATKPQTDHGVRAVSGQGNVSCSAKCFSYPYSARVRPGRYMRSEMISSTGSTAEEAFTRLRVQCESKIPPASGIFTGLVAVKSVPLNGSANESRMCARNAQGNWECEAKCSSAESKLSNSRDWEPGDDCGEVVVRGVGDTADAAFGNLSRNCGQLFPNNTDRLRLRATRQFSTYSAGTAASPTSHDLAFFCGN